MRKDQSEKETIAHNVCGTCKNYLRYSVAYEDPEEPQYCGFCNLEGWNTKYVEDDTPACETWENSDPLGDL